MWIANRWINPADGHVDFDSLVELNFLTTAERDILRAGVNDCFGKFALVFT